MVKYEYRRGGRNHSSEARPVPLITALSPPIIFGGEAMEWTSALETIFSIIGQNAFPIVCCVYLLYDKRRSDDQHKQEIDDLRDTMTTALNNNTIALQKLIDKLG